MLSWKQTVVYLGSCYSEHGKALAAIKHRICCADTVVERLNGRVFQRRGVDSRLKGHFMDIAVFSSLLYGLEHCAIGARDQRCLDGYFLRLAKRVLHLQYNYHLSYEEAENRLGIQRPSIRLRRDRLRWIGHVLRSEETILQEVLHFVPTGGARNWGRPRLRYYDTLKFDIKERGIIINTNKQTLFWEAVKGLASNRQQWRRIVML